MLYFFLMSSQSIIPQRGKGIGRWNLFFSLSGILFRYFGIDLETSMSVKDALLAVNRAKFSRQEA
jgi:hypothetical protein